MEFRCVEECSDCCVQREYYPTKQFGKIGVLILPNEKEKIEKFANDNKIEIYMTRSWATVSNGKEKILPHKHKQSHISFAYYLKKNLEDSNIMFHNEHFQNEIIPGLFTNRSMRAGEILKEINLYNASSLEIKVEEDDIVVFPSKALHGTQSNKSNMGRISISGDIVCVAKDSKLLENMMPPVNNWDKM